MILDAKDNSWEINEHTPPLKIQNPLKSPEHKAKPTIKSHSSYGTPDPLDQPKEVMEPAKKSYPPNNPANSPEPLKSVEKLEHKYPTNQVKQKDKEKKIPEIKKKRNHNSTIETVPKSAGQFKE